MPCTVARRDGPDCVHFRVLCISSLVSAPPNTERRRGNQRKLTISNTQSNVFRSGALFEMHRRETSGAVSRATRAVTPRYREIGIRRSSAAGPSKGSNARTDIDALRDLVEITKRVAIIRGLLWTICLQSKKSCAVSTGKWITWRPKLAL